MSYILDALKKSQQQREQQQSPSLPTHSPKQSISKNYYLWGVVLMVSIIVLFEMFSVSEESIPTIAKPAMPINQVTTPAIQVHQAPAIQAVTNIIQTADSHTAQPIQPEEEAIILKNNDVPEITVAKNTDHLKDYPTWDELPASVRSSIPAIHIEAHIYDANPSKRMAIINGSLTHQGQVTSQNLKILEITSTGIIACYQSNCFQRDLF